MLVYVSHPFGGKESNKESVEAKIKDLMIKYPTQVFLSPIHLLGYMYHSVSYEQGMKMCLELLSMCDYMVVTGNYRESVGCLAEIGYAMAHGIEYRVEKC